MKNVETLINLFIFCLFRCRKFIVLLTNEFVNDSLSDYLLKNVFCSSNGNY